MARLKSNSAQIAFEQIKERINRFDLLPGDTVSDLNLAKELDMSRTPIREAFQKLIQYNLVEKQRTKFVVKNITIVDINEILEARQAIECQAVKILIKNNSLNEDKFKELYKIQEDIEKSIEEKNFNLNFHLDSKFHTRIIEYTQNTRLIEIIKNLNIQGERLRWISLLTPQSYDRTVDEHNIILESLQTSNCPKAIESIQTHLQTAKKNYDTISSNSDWIDIILSFKQMLKA
jgi:DNA-binding GntR family transcriptional regulator